MARAVPEAAVVLTGNTDGNTIVEAVAAEGFRPIASSDIEAAGTHRSSGIETGTIGGK